MIESLARRPRLPPRRARQDARAPAGHARGRGRARDPVHHRHPRRHRREPRRPHRRARGDRRVARTPRPRAGGDRPELPAEARHRDAHARRRARPTSTSWPIAAGPADPAARRSTCRRRRTSPTTSASLLDAGIDDWGGVSPVTADHVNPERPWPALDRLREVTEATGFALAPRLTDLPRVRRAIPSGGSTRRCASRCWTASDAEGLGRDDPARCSPSASSRATSTTAPRSCSSATLDRVVLGRRCIRRARARRRRAAARSARCSTACSLGQEVGVDEIVTLFAARGPEVARGRRRWPTSCAARPSATSSPSCATATSTTRTSARSSAGSAAFSKGPLSLNLRGTPYLLDARGHRSDACVEAVDVRRHRGVPAGRHPPRLRRRLLHRRRPRREGGRARHPRPRLHRARGHRGRPRLGEPLADYLRRLMDAGLRDAARHRGRDPRRRGPRDPLPRQDQHRGVARGAPHRALGRPALERHDHVRHRRAARCTWARHLVRTRDAAEGDRRVHRVRAAAVRAHGRADLPAAQGPARARRSARSLLMHAVGRIAYRGLDRQHPGVVGEDRRRRRPRRCCRPACNDLGGTLMDENISRAAGRQPRPGAGRGRASARIVEPLGRTARAAHHALRPSGSHARRPRPHSPPVFVELGLDVSGRVARARTGRGARRHGRSSPATSRAGVRVAVGDRRRARAAPAARGHVGHGTRARLRPWLVRPDPVPHRRSPTLDGARRPARRHRSRR